jgi:hypothetical protein
MFHNNGSAKQDRRLQLRVTRALNQRPLLGKSGRLLFVLSISQFDPEQTWKANRRIVEVCRALAKRDCDEPDDAIAETESNSPNAKCGIRMRVFFF